MEKIRLAKSSDLPRIEKMFRRVRASMESKGIYCWSKGYPENSDFENDVATKSAYILTDGGMIKAYMAIATDLLDNFYPESHDEQKLLALLSDVKSDGDEKGIVIERLMVDPAFRQKGYGKELLNSLHDRYPHSLWIALVVASNSFVFPFYENMGFLQAGYHEFEYGENSHCLVLYKRD